MRASECVCVWGGGGGEGTATLTPSSNVDFPGLLSLTITLHKLLLHQQYISKITSTYQTVQQKIKCS